MPVIKDEGIKFCSDALKVQLEPVVLDPHYGVIWMSYLKGNMQMLVFLDFFPLAWSFSFTDEPSNFLPRE